MRPSSVGTDKQESSCVWFYRQQHLGNPNPSRRPIDRHQAAEMGHGTAYCQQGRKAKYCERVSFLFLTKFLHEKKKNFKNRKLRNYILVPILKIANLLLLLCYFIFVFIFL